MSRQVKDSRIILIYDDKCSLCGACMKWIELHAIQKGLFEFVPCRSEERKSRFPEITDDACLESLHIILPDNRILSGDKALPEIISRLKGFRWFSVLFRTPVIKVVMHIIYQWIANNRYIISRTLWPLMNNK